MSFEEFKQTMTEVARERFRNADEELSFGVRRGVTFHGYEVFLGNRIAQVAPKKVEHNIGLGRLRPFCEHLYTQILRGRTLAPWNPNQYMRQDVDREIVHAFIRVLSAVHGKEKAQELVDKVWSKILHASGEDNLTEAARFYQTRVKLEGIIAELLQPKPEPKEKTQRSAKKEVKNA